MSEDKNIEKIVEKSQESDKVEKDQERAENDSNRIETKVEKDQEQANNDLGRIETLEKENDVLIDRCKRLQADCENLEKQSIQRVSQETPGPRMEGADLRSRGPLRERRCC